MLRQLVLLLTVSFILTACGQLGAPSDKLEVAADELLQTATGCLLEVREGGASYDRAGNCTALDGAVTRYIDAGGLHPDESIVTKHTYEVARATAWSALAVSLSREAGQGSDPRIW